MSRNLWPDRPDAYWIELLQEDIDARTTVDSFRNQYLCEYPRGSGMTSFQLNRLRPPSLFVMMEKQIQHMGPRFISDLQRTHIRVISAQSFLVEPSVIRGSLWSDFDVDHAVWEDISKRWSYPREDQFKNQAWTICRLIEDRTQQRPSMLEGFGKFYDERAKAETAVQAERDAGGEAGEGLYEGLPS